MSDFAVIIPTRGDRPKLLDFCFRQISEMTIKPSEIFIIDHPPLDHDKDICSRIAKGIETAKAAGFDKIYILEDDDLYPADYFERMELNGFDFVGTETSLYYNIKNRTYEYLYHRERSSLYNTGFKISALTGFKWPEDKVTFLDIKLWRHAKRQRRKINFVKGPIGIGIKHGIGLCGGSGHRRTLALSDSDFSVFRTLVSNEAFDFYMSLL